LAEASEERDHLYQVAGDIIEGLPDALNSAEEALDRTSYALAVMGEDFLKGRISLDDRARVDGALRTAPFASRDKESSPKRLASRFLEGLSPTTRVAYRFAVEAPKGVAPSAEHYFFDNPEKREVRQFVDSGAVSNKPGVVLRSWEEGETPFEDKELEKAPPTPSMIVEEPGGSAFGTLNRFIIKTDEPGVVGVPTSRDELPKSPDNLKKG
jgi:hypothetical protein